MARAALGLGVRDLAELADISPNTVARLERGERLHLRTLHYVRGALEAAGVVFLDPGEVSAWGGEGIRYGRSKSLSPMAIVFEKFRELPDLERKTHLAYLCLVEILEVIINIIESEGREPDLWERVNLAEAADALGRSSLYSAQAILWLAITPPDNQSKDYPIPPDEAAAVANCDLAYFRRCISEIRSRGLRSK